MKLTDCFGKAILALTAIMAMLLVSCGGSRDDSLFFDEETFPTEEGASDILLDQQAEESDLQADEAEVLRLLGITKEEKTAVPEEKASTGTTAGEATPLEAELSKLERQVTEKDRELESIRAELNAKSDRISNLEQELRQAGSRKVSTQPIAGGSSEFKLGYQHALTMYNSHDYRAAIQEFERLLSIDATNSLSDNCQYWIGECYYGLANYNEAIIEFEKVFNHANSNKYDDAQLKLGLCYMQLGDNAKARAEFERLLTNYPDSEYVTKADQYLSGL